MVHYALPALALLAVSSCVAAAPTTTIASRTTSTAPFTFAQWVEDIIADPYGDHLTPTEAVAAKDAAVAAANPLAKRVSCRDDIPKSANANDAAACVQYLAQLGANGVNCGMGQFDYAITMCGINQSYIVGSKSSSPSGVSTNCNNIARTGGKIFDSCWRSDNTVKGSEMAIDGTGIYVTISGWPA